MHKDIVTAEMNISEDGNISGVIIENIEHLPLGCQMNMMKFHEWWNDRAIPKTRQGADYALNKLGYKSTKSMLVAGMALSLTDCYWVKLIKSDLCWKDVSLFNRRVYVDDAFGKVTFGEKGINTNTARLITSQGEVRKMWCTTSKSDKCLVKGTGVILISKV